MELSAFFQQHPRAALAFSGGVDSAYLLYAAMQCGADVRAYYVKSAFQPQFELEDAQRLAKLLGADLRILNVDILSVPCVTENPPERCYHCKRAIFSRILAQAASDGYQTILDGTNASDDAGDRPGMRALRELSVLSPLRECGLTKDAIRRLSRQAGLFTWDKPAYACLATRTPTGTPITAEQLARTEAAETALRELGFSDLRVRVMGSAARIQVPVDQMARLLEQRSAVIHCLKGPYQAVLLDLEART